MPYGTGTGGFQATANMFTGGNSMNPLIIPAAIQGVSSLLGFLKKDPQKQQQEFAAQESQKERDWRDKWRREKIGVTKPQTPYYEAFGNLPAIDYLLQKSFLGNLGKYLGNDTMQKYGIDLNDILGTIGLNKPFSQTPSADRYGTPSPTPPSVSPRDVLMRRYMENEDQFGGRGGRFGGRQV